MRLGLVSSPLALALLLAIGCDANTPKQWQKGSSATTTKATATAPAPVPTPTQTNVAPAPTPAPKPPAPTPTPGEEWGGSAIAWRTSEAGMIEAKQSGKPVMVVLFTTWCPHCKNYSKLFSDARVVEASKPFVMIRANADDEEEFAKKYAPDGGYIPRTLFLEPNGALRSEIRASDAEYKYFYNERDPAPLLAAMERAKTLPR
jgi:thiol-disulfide isomerase/thioredoxin